MTNKYSVVFYFNYRKELSAGFCKYFDIYSDACKYARHLAEIDSINKEINMVIKEEDITDNNGPSYTPYDSIVGYGGSKNGYCTMFYCVVVSFPGVENSWDEMDDEMDDENEADENDENEINKKWLPKYY